ncbi:MAG: hypothetical protein QM607_04820 [Microbacterium sp.]
MRERLSGSEVRDLLAVAGVWSVDELVDLLRVWLQEPQEPA